MLEQFRLDGRRVVVTGASRGLGLAAAQLLAKAGAELVLVARDGGGLEKVASAIIAQTGSSVIVSQLDVTKSADVEDVFEGICRQGKIDVLVNCAGIQYQHPVEEFPDSDWDEVLATNLTGTFYCARAFARRCEREGSIINFASVASSVGVSRQVAYSASKAGVVGLTRALAVELSPREIRVNAIAPGYFNTGMPSSILEDPDQTARLLRRVPLRRIADPDEIGPPVVFLASDASRFMTGAILKFDGGYTAW